MGKYFATMCLKEAAFTFDENIISERETINHKRYMVGFSHYNEYILKKVDFCQYFGI